MIFSKKHSQHTSAGRVPASLRAGSRGWLRVIAGLSLFVAGCSGFADFLTPGERGSDTRLASVALRAEVVLGAGSATDAVTLNVQTSYLRLDSSRVQISTQTITLRNVELQPVPIPIDVATCLADPSKDGSGTNCSVVINIALLVNGVVVDEQVIGPLRLTPGQPTNVSTPVTLFEIDSVGIVGSGATTLLANGSLLLAPGATGVLAARIVDSRGQLVTDRAVVWSSDASGVVTVSRSGVLTAITEGTATVSAVLGARRASLPISVVRPRATLTVATSLTTGRGTVSSTPAGINCKIVDGVGTGSCSFAFDQGASVTLTSTAETRYQFTGWGSDCAPTSASCVVAMTTSRLASAQFTALRRVTVQATAGSDGTGIVSGPAGLACAVSGTSLSGSCSVDLLAGQSITLVATSASALVRFAGWETACAASGGAECVLQVADRDLTVGAGFVGSRALTLASSGSGSGVVTGAMRVGDADSTVLSCFTTGGATSGDCSRQFAQGASVEITAVAGSNSSFTGWSGACAGLLPTCTVRLADATSVTAAFTLRRATLTVRVGGTGAGELLLNGEPFCAIAIGAPEANCATTVDVGTVLTLRATAGNFSTFTGFTGSCTGTSECELTLLESRAVRATFEAVRVSVSMTSAGAATGSGRILATAADGGFSCGFVKGNLQNPALCVLSVLPMSSVTLRSEAEPGSALLSWGEACAGTTGLSCVLAPASNATASARYGAATDVAMVLTGSTGLGSVSFEVPGMPSQTVCLAKAGAEQRCRFSLPIGAAGVFRGVAAPGSQFIGFTGPCDEGTGPVPTCTYRAFGFVREIRASFQLP